MRRLYFPLVLTLLSLLPTGAPAAAATPFDNQAAYRFAVATAAAAEGDYRRALTAFAEAVELAPEEPYLRIEYARLLARLGHFAPSPEQRTRRFALASGQLAEAQRLAPDDRDVLREVGEIYLDLAADDGQALVAARDALEAFRALEPFDPQVLVLLGQIYRSQGDGESAVEALREAVGTVPGNAWAQSLLEKSLLELVRQRLRAGNSDGVEELLAEALSLSSENLEARLILADLQSSRGDHAAAVATLRAGPPSAEASRRLVNVLLRADQGEEAEAVLRQLLAESPGDSEALLALADLQGRRGDHAAAAATLAAGLEGEGGGDPEVRDRLVYALLRSGEAGRAEALAAEAVALDPASVEARLTLADLESRRGDHAAAVATLSAGLASLEEGETDAELLERLAYELMLSGDRAAAAERMDRLEEAGQPVRLLGLLTLGALGRTQAAVTGAVELIDGEVGSVELAGALGHEMARLGWREQGVEFLQALVARLEAADRSTEAAAARRDLAELYAAGDEWSEVAQLLEDRAGSADLGLTLLYADALSHLGRGAEALALLAASPAAAEGTPSPLAKKAEVLYRLDREQEALALLRSLTGSEEAEARMEAVRTFQRLELYADAIPVLEQLVAEDPEAKEATYYLGAAYERTGRHEQAASTFNRLLAVDPQFAPALNYLGYMWAERGENLAEALSLVNRALAVEPDNGAYIDSLGWTHFQLGDLERARFHLERAARLLPDDPTVLEHLGDVYTELGEAEQARRSYQRSLALGAEDAEQVRRKLEALDQQR